MRSFSWTLAFALPTAARIFAFSKTASEPLRLMMFMSLSPSNAKGPGLKIAQQPRPGVQSAFAAGALVGARRSTVRSYTACAAA